MQGKPLIMLALAGTLGLGAMLMTKMMLNKQPTAAAPTRDVLVAVRDFNAEEILRPEMVKTVKMAESAIPAGYFAAPEDVADRWVKTTLLEGEPIVERKLGPKGTPPGLVANIPKGMRAFAVEVNEQSGVSGFILPSHRVDVINFETSDKSMSRGETILQNVLVLAAGQVFVKSDEKTLQSRTVTLAVSPDQVDMLVAAKAKGMLSLALRGVNDHEIIDRPPPDAATDDEEKNKRLELEKALAQMHRDYDAEKRRHEPETGPRVEPAPIVRVGYIYRGPGAKKEPFELNGRDSLPLPIAAPEQPLESPDDSEDEPVPAPESFDSGGLAVSSRAGQP